MLRGRKSENSSSAVRQDRGDALEDDSKQLKYNCYRAVRWALSGIQDAYIKLMKRALPCFFWYAVMRNHVRTNSASLKTLFCELLLFMVHIFCRNHTECPASLCTLAIRREITEVTHNAIVLRTTTSYVVHKNICGSIIKASNPRQGFEEAKFRGKPPPSPTTTPTTKTVSFSHCRRTTFHVFFIMCPSFTSQQPPRPRRVTSSLPFTPKLQFILNNSQIRHREKEEL